MRVLVDTGVFSALISRRRRARFDPQVGLMAGNQMVLAAVTVAELRYGSRRRLGRRTPSAAGAVDRSDHGRPGE